MHPRILLTEVCHVCSDVITSQQHNFLLNDLQTAWDEVVYNALCLCRFYALSSVWFFEASNVEYFGLHFLIT